MEQTTRGQAEPGTNIASFCEGCKLFFPADAAKVIVDAHGAERIFCLGCLDKVPKRGRPKKTAETAAAQERELREDAISRYSANRRCGCCKTRDVRVLMIVPRDPQFYQTATMTTPKMLRRLRAAGWPPGQRVRCANCQYVRMLWPGGVCSHKEKEETGNAQ